QLGDLVRGSVDHHGAEGRGGRLRLLLLGTGGRVRVVGCGSLTRVVGGGRGVNGGVLGGGRSGRTHRRPSPTVAARSEQQDGRQHCAGGDHDGLLHGSRVPHGQVAAATKGPSTGSGAKGTLASE